MTQRDDGGPAFPSPDNRDPVQHMGMSLRDYFAGQFLAGIAGRGILTNQAIADEAYKFADAMLKAREAK